MSAAETNNNKKPQCQVVRHQIGKQKIYLVYVEENLFVAPRQLQSEGFIQTVQVFGDSILHFPDVFHSSTSTCQYKTVYTWHFNLNIVRPDVRLN